MRSCPFTWKYLLNADGKLVRIYSKAGSQQGRILSLKMSEIHLHTRGGLEGLLGGEVGRKGVGGTSCSSYTRRRIRASAECRKLPAAFPRLC